MPLQVVVRGVFFVRPGVVLSPSHAYHLENALSLSFIVKLRLN